MKEQTFLNPTDILDFWFSERVKPMHFMKKPAFDQEIIDKFHDLYIQAQSHQLDDWKASIEGCLALVIMLDQFPRNMFRDTVKAFSTDAQARNIAQHAIQQKQDTSLTCEQRIFLYMPFMHSERLGEQEQSVKLYTQLGQKDTLKYAIMHHDIIARFGRFPHRNAILNRPSTPEEVTFLKEPNSSF